jgi:hypothetical protein
MIYSRGSYFVTRRLSAVLFFLTISAIANGDSWMSQIPNDRVFNQLMIPGTHDSGTYNITSASHFSLSPDDPLPLWIEIIDNILPNTLVRSVVAGWSKTQPETITQQLSAGIRYLDFRAGIYPGDGHFYLSHALLSVRLADALSQVQLFASMNPTEIVIVDINHVFGVTNTAQEEQLVGLLQTYLGQYTIPNTFYTTDTIGTLRAHGNVIVLMDIGQAISNPALAQFAAQNIWHQSAINSIWPNDSTLPTLQASLTAEMAARAAQKTHTRLFVLQMIQTESTDQIIDGILDPAHNPTTIENYAAPVNAAQTDWIYGYIHAYGANQLNIIIQDWYTNQSSLVPLAMQYDTAPQSLAAPDAVSPGKIAALKAWVKKLRH